jgi:phosphonate transport system permease protein
VTQGALQIPQDLLHFAERLVPPDLSPDFLASLWLPVLQTLAISLLGTLIGVVLGGPLALFATSRLVLPPPGEPDRRPWVSVAARRTVYWASRGILSVLRSIPELVWALICIIAIGIGPFAGTLALGLHTTGVLGKLYADTMEEVKMQPVEALRALGASPLQLLLWAIWPQTKQLMASYTVLRWDMNLRAATILGLVGGGGLGQVMYNDVQLGFYPRVATLIVVIYGLVMATDWAGTRIWTAMPE